MKSHYDTQDESPEMIQEKLWILVISAMNIFIRIKWLEMWNNSPTLYEALKHMKPKFNDIEIPKWLHKAT